MLYQRRHNINCGNVYKIERREPGWGSHIRFKLIKKNTDIVRDFAYNSK